MIFVLDDFYLIQDNPDICETIEFLLKHLPLCTHMVIISRVEPKIRISRLRVMNQVLEIKESDLAFTPAEIKGLYSNLFHLILTRDNLEKLYQKTKGWRLA